MSGWRKAGPGGPSIAFLSSPRVARRRLPAPSWAIVAAAFAIGVSLAVLVIGGMNTPAHAGCKAPADLAKTIGDARRSATPLRVGWVTAVWGTDRSRVWVR